MSVHTQARRQIVSKSIGSGERNARETQSSAEGRSDRRDDGLVNHR
jgi:hypothetical protein